MPEGPLAASAKYLAAACVYLIASALAVYAYFSVYPTS